MLPTEQSYLHFYHNIFHKTSYFKLNIKLYVKLRSKVCLDYLIFVLVCLITHFLLPRLKHLNESLRL